MGRLNPGATQHGLTVADLSAQLQFGPGAFGPLAERVAPLLVTGDLSCRLVQMVQDSVDGVRNMRGQRGEKAVTQMLFECYEHGLFMFGDQYSAVNSEIVPAIRYIF